MRIDIVPATPDDSQFAFEVKKSAFKEYVEQVWGWDEDQQLELHRDRFSAQEFFVIWVDGQSVGVLALVSGPELLTLNQLFLNPAFQGRGIGRACMDWVIAKAQGREVGLNVMKVNPRARAFYERLGFEVVAESETHWDMRRDPASSPGFDAP